MIHTFSKIQKGPVAVAAAVKVYVGHVQVTLTCPFVPSPPDLSVPLLELRPPPPPEASPEPLLPSPLLVLPAPPVPFWLSFL
jgi:hypothetical protein